MPHIQDNVGHLFREFSGKMASVLLRIFGFEHSTLIDDIIQDTFLAALRQWKAKGIPDYAEAWLMRVAKNKTINELKRKGRDISGFPLEFVEDETQIEALFLDHEIQDSQLRALLACCSSDLSQKAQIMLTLKTLSGFGDREIAGALYMTPEAVKKSIYRSRKMLQKEYNSLKVPTIQHAKERFPTVIHVLYLMFNEGYKTSEQDRIIDEDLCFEAIRLAKLLIQLEECIRPEGNALLALMYFSMARFSERQNKLGELVSIENQDRRKWDQTLISLGFSALSKSRSGEKLTRYHLEATIAATHVGAPTFNETDWAAIERCYELLLKTEPTLSVKLSHAIAVGYHRGFGSGIELLKVLEKEESKPSYLLLAALAKLYDESGQPELTRSYYQVAIDLCTNKHDKAFLNKQLLQVLTRSQSISN